MVVPSNIVEIDVSVQ